MNLRIVQQFHRFVLPITRYLAADALPDQTVRSITRTGIVILSLLAAFYVARLGSNVPNSDEWDFVPQIVGQWPATEWYFTHHNEHRYPVARALWVTSVRLTGDFRTPMFLTVLLLGVSSALLARAAEVWRGRPSIGDLLIPSLLLNWGHGLNLTMGYQLAFSVYALGLAGIVWSAATKRFHLLGIFSGLTVLCGGFGMAAAGPLFLLCVWLGVTRCRMLLGWAVAIVGYTGWEVLTFPSAARVPGTNPVLGFVANLATGWGMAVTHRVMMYWWLAAVVSLLGFIAAIWQLRRYARIDAVCLAAVLAIVLLSTVAVAYSRGAGAIGDRFVTPSAVGLAVIAIILGRNSNGWQLPLAIAIFVVNAAPGYRYGRMCHQQVVDFEADMSRQLPPMFLGGIHGGGLPFLNSQSMANGTEQLNVASWGGFRNLPANPSIQTLPAEAPLPRQITCGPRELKPGNSPPMSLEFVDPKQSVLGLRIRGEQLFPQALQQFVLTWTDVKGVEHKQTAIPRVVPGPFEMNIPIGGQPRSLRLTPTTIITGIRIDTADWLLPAENVDNSKPTHP